MNRIIDGRVECSHVPEPHVVYDRPKNAYRAVIRCTCRRITVEARRPFTGVHTMPKWLAASSCASRWRRASDD